MITREQLQQIPDAVLYSAPIIGYVCRTGHGSQFKETISPELAALEWGGKKMWVPVCEANAAPDPGMVNRLCQVMLKHGMSTGHGDTLAQVIDELDWQLKELREKNAAQQDQDAKSFFDSLCSPCPICGGKDAKDAARYRWLRNSSHWPVVFAMHDAPEPLRDIDLDAVIDQAMKEKP